MQNIISENEKTWDGVADQFVDASALPVWGPFGVGDDLNLIPEIAGKIFLEVGCGSGRSIKYLMDNGAEKVYGLDVSAVQIAEAEHYNQEKVSEGKVVLIKSPMEDLISIEPVDIIYSVYAIGWTVDPAVTLKNIYSYLKPGGMFIWSWEHTMFPVTQYEDGKFVAHYAYHGENQIALPNWKKGTGTAYLNYRKTGTWFQFLRDAGFEIAGYHEPAPKNLSRGSDDPTRYYSIQKAEKVPATFIFVCKKPL
jgi:SAM-dependent methyltransferase